MKRLVTHECPPMKCADIKYILKELNMKNNITDITIDYKGFKITLGIDHKPESCLECPFYVDTSNGNDDLSPFGWSECQLGAGDIFGIFYHRAKDCPWDR